MHPHLLMAQNPVVKEGSKDEGLSGFLQSFPLVIECQFPFRRDVRPSGMRFWVREGSNRVLDGMICCQNARDKRQKVCEWRVAAYARKQAPSVQYTRTLPYMHMCALTFLCFWDSEVAERWKSNSGFVFPSE